MQLINIIILISEDKITLRYHSKGLLAERTVDGVGYVEMTGYAEPFRLTE